jgi:hypothetical protein
MWQLHFIWLAATWMRPRFARPHTFDSSFPSFSIFFFCPFWSLTANDLCIGMYYGRALAGSAGAEKNGKEAIGL